MDETYVRSWPGEELPEGGIPAPHNVMGPPDNELPVTVAQDAVLARTDDTAVALERMQVFSTGLVFDLVVRVRDASQERGGDQLSDLVGVPGMAGGTGLLLGVEFSDGRRATNASAWVGPSAAGDSGVQLVDQGGSSGGRTCDVSLWLTPLPPPGPLLVVFACVGLGIDETRTVLDGGVIAEAATRVVELWPWQPWEGERWRQPPRPELPPGWFSDVLRPEVGDDA